MPNKCILALVPILAALALPAAAEEPGSEVSNLLGQMKNLFNFDENNPDSDSGESADSESQEPAWDRKSSRLSAEQSFKEAQEATRSEDWPRASRAAQKAIGHYLALTVTDSGDQYEADQQMLKHCHALFTNAAYHLKGGPLYQK
jgi:hypothetical protein